MIELTITQLERAAILGMLCIVLLYVLGTMPSYAAGHIPVSAVAP